MKTDCNGEPAAFSLGKPLTPTPNNLATCAVLMVV
jgi:hypothetical protein